MKKLLILLMASLLTLSTALAEVIYSPEVTALKAALAALREKYGFTLTTAGVFYPKVTLTEDGAQVVFQPCTYLPVDRLGEYTAVITGEDVTLTWSHADRAADLTAAPDCPFWGHAQVQTYFDQGVIARATPGWKTTSPPPRNPSTFPISTTILPPPGFLWIRRTSPRINCAKPPKLHSLISFP
jgi:hypothetical protein